MQNLNEMIDNSISITRNISNSLMPNLLIDFGLINALESFIKKINTTQKITIDFKNNLNRDLKIQRNIEIIVYRILIELINNSLKHSKAENIKISFFDNKDLRIYYSDNGVGFNMQEKLKDKKGNGLFNILNRLNAINSKYQFKSETNKGVHFKFEIKNK